MFSGESYRSLSKDADIIVSITKWYDLSEKDSVETLIMSDKNEMIYKTELPNSN